MSTVSPPISILSVSKDPSLLESRTRILQSAGYIVETATHWANAVHQFRSGEFNAVVLCHSVPESDRIAFLRSLREQGYTVPVVLVRCLLPPYFRDAFVILCGETEPAKLLECIRSGLRSDRAVHLTD